MKRVFLNTIYSLFALLLSFCSFGQGTVKNGVVVDAKAQGIITNAASRISKDSPLSFSFSSINKGEKKAQRGSVLLSGGKYVASFASNTIYCDGKSVWSYNPQTNEVNINDIDATGNDMINISTFISNANKNFRPKLIRKQGVNYILDLTPNHKSSISKVRLAINSSIYRLSSMEVHYYSGNIVSFNISNYKAKAKTTANSFVFPKKKYPKAQIVDLR